MIIVVVLVVEEGDHSIVWVFMRSSCIVKVLRNCSFLVFGSNLFRKIFYLFDLVLFIGNLVDRRPDNGCCGGGAYSA